MSTPKLTNEQQAAFDILHALKTQNKDVSSLNTAEKQLLYTHYTPDAVDCYSPLVIPENKSCCNRNFSKKLTKINYTPLTK